MKKKIATTALILCALMGTTACGGEIVDNIDKNKTQIYIAVPNDGTGYAWIEKQAATWNKTNEKYEVKIQPQQVYSNNVLSDLNLGSSVGIDAYYVGDAGLRLAIEKGQLEDLSDVLDMKVDGTNRTIGDKLRADEEYYNIWQSHAAKTGEGGMYMLPYTDSFNGMVFDYDTFADNGWLTKVNANDETAKADLTAQSISYEVSGANLIFKSYSGSGRVNYVDGDVIMAAGKDGKYGNYDEGQPQNMTEWNQMINKIVSTGSNKAFLWSGEYSGYTDDIVIALMAQYSGINAYNAYYSFDSKGVALTMNDGSTKVITPDNGYEVYGLDGYQKAVEFMNTYFNNSRYIHPKSTSNITHIEAQNLYLLGHRGEVSNPFSAILVDGAWWENEAHAMFDSIAVKEADRGYGKRDYRYMLLPEFDGQKGIDEEGNGSVLSVRASGSIVVPKCSDSGKLAAIKEFLGYTLSDANLRAFTVETGIIRPYDFELTDADRAAMTPFACTLQDIYADKENIKLVRPMLDANCAPIRFMNPSFHTYLMPVKADGVPYDCVIEALEAGKSVEQVISGTQGYYTSGTWSGLLNTARAEGFYN